jgi:poly-gamma-glutamate biosynthesis protein PgsC/CapC
LLTLTTAAATYGAVRLFSRFAIVYGRRRIVMMVLCGFLLGCLVRSLPRLTGQMLDGEATTLLSGFHVIGFIIPGLIAIWMDRQGWVETWAPLLTSSVVVRLALILIGMETLQ